MTPLDAFNALTIGASSIYSLIFGLGMLFLAIAVPIFGIYAVARYMLWPGLCRFGNWLGRP